MLALHDFVTGGQFDLVVLDTPPTANALDFLDAPNRLAAAVSSPALRWFARPPEEAGRRLSLQRFRSGGALVLRRMAKLVGNRFLDDVGAFLVDFQGVLGGFLARAQAIERLLRAPDAAFLLVLVPAVAAVDEALYFHARLQEAAIPLGGFIANRVHPAPGLVDADALAAALRAQPALAGLPGDTIGDAAARLAPMARATAALHASERRELARLASRAPGVAHHRGPSARSRRGQPGGAARRGGPPLERFVARGPIPGVQRSSQRGGSPRAGHRTRARPPRRAARSAAWAGRPRRRARSSSASAASSHTVSHTSAGPGPVATASPPSAPPSAAHGSAGGAGPRRG